MAFSLTTAESKEKEEGEAAPLTINVQQAQDVLAQEIAEEKIHIKYLDALPKTSHGEPVPTEISTPVSFGIEGSFNANRTDQGE